MPAFPFRPLSGKLPSAAAYMRRVYAWMGAGLLASAASAACAAGIPQIRTAIARPRTAALLILLHFGLGAVLSANIRSLTDEEAGGCFFLYCAVTGVMLASVLMRRPPADAVSAFACAAGMFLAMSAWGATAGRGFEKLGDFVFMGAVGLIIALIVNFFLHSTLFGFLISCCGVAVFAAMAAWSTWRLRNFGPGAYACRGERSAIRGALALYVSFIGMFRHILRVMRGTGRG